MIISNLMAKELKFSAATGSDDEHRWYTKTCLQLPSVRTHLTFDAKKIQMCHLSRGTGQAYKHKIQHIKNNPQHEKNRSFIH